MKALQRSKRHQARGNSWETPQTTNEQLIVSMGVPIGSSICNLPIDIWLGPYTARYGDTLMTSPFDLQSDAYS